MNIEAGTFVLLTLGFLFGLKHATEVDHVVAVSSIVSEHRSFVRSAFVGGLWGAGHTASLLVVGCVVLVLKIAIPANVSGWLEFAVALMIVGLGLSAIFKTQRSYAHIHKHA